MKRSTKASRKTALRLVHRNDRKGVAHAVRTMFTGAEQLALPMLELITNAKATLESVLGHTSRELIELLLRASAEELAGAKTPGRASGEVRWHGMQRGRGLLGDRQVRVLRPRLRSRGAASQEVAIPLYAKLNRDASLGERMHPIVVAGVSTRNYAGVLPETAETVGVCAPRPGQ